MKIISSSIWNNSFEKDLLWLKLYHESPLVEKWIINQNFYDYHGRFKGDTLTEVLKESKFTPYLDRIHTIPINQKFGDPSQESNIDPKEFANAEWELRDASMSYILENYTDDDIILNEDIDEFADFTNSKRIDKFFQETKDRYPLQWDRYRYIYDWDNRAFRDYCDMVNPVYRVKHLKQGVKLRDKKWIGRQIGHEYITVFFEGCHIFSYESYLSKHSSSLHTGWRKEDLDEALLTNTWPRASYQTNMPDKNNRWHWFSKVQLTENNTTKYILDNLNKLKTNLVAPNYIENRIKLYGFDGLFPENKDFPK